MFHGQRYLKTAFCSAAIVLFCGSSIQGQTGDPFASDGKPTSATVAATTPARPVAARPNDRMLTVFDANLKTELALHNMTKADYFETRAADLLEEIKAANEMEIVVHESAIENNFDDDTLITISLKQCRLSTMLDTILEVHHCTYAVNDGIVFVISKDAAIDENWLQLRDFDCRGIINAAFGGDSKEFVSTVQALVESSSWEDSGGTARIRDVDGQVFVIQTSVNMRKIVHLIERMKAGREVAAAEH